MAQKRNSVKFNTVRFSKYISSNWIEITKSLINKLKCEKKTPKVNKKDQKTGILFKNFKEIGNYLFKQNEYKNAKDLYTISLIFIPIDKIFERSLNFSNRAQCSIFLGGKIQSLADCISALKLYLRHDKSWYRKIFVNKGCKDYLNCVRILLFAQSLSVRFVKKHVCTQSEFYGKNLTRLGYVSLKKKRTREFFHRCNSTFSLINQSQSVKGGENFLIILDWINFIQITFYFLIGYLFSCLRNKKIFNFKNNPHSEIRLIFRYNLRRLKISFSKISNFPKILIHTSRLFNLIGRS